MRWIAASAASTIVFMATAAATAAIGTATNAAATRATATATVAPIGPSALSAAAASSASLITPPNATVAPFFMSSIWRCCASAISLFAFSIAFAASLASFSTILGIFFNCVSAALIKALNSFFDKFGSSASLAFTSSILTRIEISSVAILSLAHELAYVVGQLFCQL